MTAAAATEKTDYRRLPGSGPMSPAKAWLADDHLLLQSGGPFTDYYRRFCLRDIQALIVRRTGDGTVWSVVLASLVGLVALVAVALGSLSVVLLLTMGVLLVMLLVNVALGPTCHCHLRTAVNVQRLPMLFRMRTAARFVAVLAPRVRAVQGEMADDEIRRRAGEDHARQVSAATWTSPVSPPRRIHHYAGTMHFVLFLALLAGAAANLAEYLHHGTTWTVLAWAIWVGGIIFAILSAIKQAGSDVPVGLKVTVWVTVAYSGVAYLLLGALGPKSLEMLEYDSPAVGGVRSLALFFALASAALATAGLVQLALFRGRYRRQRIAAQADEARQGGVQ